MKKITLHLALTLLTALFVPIAFAEPVNPTTAGVSSTITRATGGVTTSDAEILAINDARLGGWIENVSDTIIWVNEGTATAAAPSTRLYPGGIYYLVYNGVSIYTGAIRAIHGGSGTKNVSIITY